MANRTHLSIGEVLSLLREEFPDITISKIRFLESQGLVDPERTPSGYRKFYDHDVERLRWILRQQREHFLPLKVIKGRLADHGEDGLPDDGPGPQVGAVQPALIPANDPSLALLSGTDPSTELAAVDPSGALVAVSAAVADASVSAAVVPSVATPVVDPSVGTPVAATAPSPVAAASAPAEAAPPGVETEASVPTADPTGAIPEPEPEPPAPTSARPVRTRSAPVARAEERTASSDSMTLHELATAAGITDALAAELADFGLLGARVTVASNGYYDEIALEVARVAGGFAAHGVEVRHLRAWRNAADREASLFEQLVLPLLRQRNPQARQQAAETLEELGTLGAELRSLLVRRALNDIR